MAASRTLKVVLTAAVVLLLAGAGGVWLGWKSAVGRASDGTTSDSIPDVRQGEIIEHEFVLTNDGPDSLVIKDALPWASTIVSMDSVIPARGEGRLRIRLDTKKWHGPMSELIKVHFTNPSRRAAWLQLKARVIRPVELEPHDRVYFFTVVGDPAEQAVEVVNNQDKPLSIVDVRSSDPAFQARSRTIRDGQRYAVTIALNPAAAVGEHRGTVTIRTDSRDYATLAIEAVAKVRDVVYTSVPEISFSTFAFESLDLEAVHLRTVVVTKHRATDFRVLRATTDIPLLKVNVVPQQAGQSYIVRVQLIREKVSRGTKFEGKLIIETNDPAHPRLELRISGAAV
jgi:hypothetical protein